MYCPTAPASTKADYMAAAETMANRFGVDEADIVPQSLGASIYSDTFENMDAYGTNILYVFVHDTQKTRLLSTEEIENALQNQCLTAIEVFRYQASDHTAPLMIRISEYSPDEEPFVAFFASDRTTVEELAARVMEDSHRTWIVTHQNENYEYSGHTSLPS